MASATVKMMFTELDKELVNMRQMRSLRWPLWLYNTVMTGILII